MTFSTLRRSGRGSLSARRFFTERGDCQRRGQARVLPREPPVGVARLLHLAHLGQMLGPEAFPPLLAVLAPVYKGVVLGRDVHAPVLARPPVPVGFDRALQGGAEPRDLILDLAQPRLDIVR